jgi:hypothetical protein
MAEEALEVEGVALEVVGASSNDSVMTWHMDGAA